MTDPLDTSTPVPDTTQDLSPAELQAAREALPTGHVCILTPRVATLEEKLAHFDDVVQKLVPLLEVAGGLTARVEALEKAPASPAAHDARLQLLEDAVKSLAPALEQHFGIKI